MPVINPPVVLKKYPRKINALGTSLFAAQSTYQKSQATSTLANIPQWVASTAYAKGNVVQNNGLLYSCKTAGTSASSGGPTGILSSITDGTVTWKFRYAQASKQNTSALFWLEAFSLGELFWDMDTGYEGNVGGVIKFVIKNGGTNYKPTDTISILPVGHGALANLVVNSAGAITAINITNPGDQSVDSGTSYSFTINTSTGSGFVGSIVGPCSGTLGVSGCFVQDMLNRVNDAVSGVNGQPPCDIIIVEAGINDVLNVAQTTATMVSNYNGIVTKLRTIYETLMSANIAVIALTNMPCTGLTTLQEMLMQKVNHWIRAYCRGEKWANPNNLRNIAIAEPSVYWMDQTSTTVSPIGGSGAGIGAMTQDGIHPSPRGAQYMALAILQAVQSLCGILPTTSARSSSMGDGFNLSNNFNPAGNCIEGSPWQASTAYGVGDIVANDTSPLKVYRCTTAGTTAGSGGPTGTGTAISDGTCVWHYSRPSGSSVFAGTTGSTTGSVGGVTCSGTIDANYALARDTGSASGTIVGSIETPYSTGQNGQRQVLTFSLGSGSDNEVWKFPLNYFGTTSYGIPSTDLGVGLYFVEAELELSSIANVSGVSIQIEDSIGTPTYVNYCGQLYTEGTSVALTMMNSASEMLPYPNSGKLYLRSQPILLPTNLTTVQPWIYFDFNCSGSAGSVTLTAKLNYFAMRRYGSA